MILVENIISDQKLEDAKGSYPLIAVLPEAVFRPGSLKDKPQLKYKQILAQRKWRG